MRKRYIATILIALAIVVYMAFNDRQETQYDGVSSEEREADFIISQLTLDHYGESGALKQVIKAEQAKHFPETQEMPAETLFTLPNVTLHQGNKEFWRLSAREGVLTGERLLTLIGEVRVIPLSDTDTRFNLSTEKLNINLDTEIADTKESVVIKDPSSEITSKGLRANLKTQQIEFTSQVRGSHDPTVR